MKTARLERPCILGDVTRETAETTPRRCRMVFRKLRTFRQGHHETSYTCTCSTFRDRYRTDAARGICVRTLRKWKMLLFSPLPPRCYKDLSRISREYRNKISRASPVSKRTNRLNWHMILQCRDFFFRSTGCVKLMRMDKLCHLHGNVVRYPMHLVIFGLHED